MLSHPAGPCPKVFPYRLGQKGNAGLAGCAASGAVLIVFIRATCAVIGIVLIIFIRTTPIGHNQSHVVLRSELRGQVIHMVVHPVCQTALDDPGHGVYGGVKVEVRVKVEEGTEDSRECTPEKAPASLFVKLASPRRPVFQAGHDFSEEVEVAGVIILVWAGYALFAYGV